jgi:tyrosine decarboxylase / aspartate 1-decarboxylase
MILEHKSLSLLSEALAELDAGFAELPDFEATVDVAAMRTVLLEVAQRMQDNYPYPHPFYAGQMLKPPHAIARLAYALAQWINPNNHALDGGRASSMLEKEAVTELAQMFGWDRHLGHLCGGGTMANLEALWVAGRLHPGKRIVASQQAHYTHARISEVLQLPFQAIPCDSQARMDLVALAAVLQAGDVGTVVVTLGTTAAGAVDPLPAILELQAQYGFRIHVDTAYGGYFKLVDNLNDQAQAAYAAIHQADSIAIDPHKHGLQPYGCGCILFKDPSVGALYKHDSPYTYFSSAELHLGEISLECSRAGAAAVALWATQRLFPLVRGGEFADMLADCRAAAVVLAAKIEADPRMRLAFDPELDIVVWSMRAESASQISALSRAIFEEAARANLHLAVANFPATMLRERWPDVEWDQEQVACLRSCLMKPEHREWGERIWTILDRVTETVLTSSSTP